VDLARASTTERNYTITARGLRVLDVEKGQIFRTSGSERCPLRAFFPEFRGAGFSESLGLAVRERAVGVLPGSAGTDVG
jgi:hypothetical protein